MSIVGNAGRRIALSRVLQAMGATDTSVDESALASDVANVLSRWSKVGPETFLRLS